MLYRLIMIDSTRRRALVAISRRGEKVIEIKWVPMGAVKLSQVMQTPHVSHYIKEITK